AWKGDLLMVAAALCMSLYTVWSRPFIRRSGALPFATIGMSIGAFTLICLSLLRGSFAPVSTLDATQWIALAYLGVFGSAVTFFLWAFALAHTTPTRVAISVTVNPISASLVGAIMLAEPIGLNILLGVLAVLLGIWIAAATSRMPVCVAGGRPGRPP
ncbi:MAG: DMT family transporter, partial [Phyllobacterium sp.]